VTLGFIDQQLMTEPNFSFKSGGVQLYVNDAPLSSTQIAALSFYTDVCKDACLVDCTSSNNVCPSNSLITAPIAISQGTQLISQLGSFLTGWTNIVEYNYFVVNIGFNTALYNQATLNNPSNANVVFVLSNIFKQSYLSYARTDLIPDSLQNGDSFSVMVANGVLVLNCYGAGALYNLMPTGYVLSQFNNVNLLFYATANANMVNVSAQYDDVVYQFTINTAQWVVEIVDRESSVFMNDGVQVATVDIERDSFGSYPNYSSAGVTPLQPNCGVANAALCLFDQNGNKTILACQPGYTSILLPGSCVPSTSS